ncbi:MAG: YaeQ family protein [Cellvibrionaceae bacterium]
MALKPTIYKARIALSDLNRDYYDTLNLTIAQHPSETLERMMVRVLAYCFNADENLIFSKGLSEPDEPDILARSLSNTMTLWVDVGEPAPERIKKATRIAELVKVYSFNAKSGIWWAQNKSKFVGLDVSVIQVTWENVQALAKLVQRTMDFSITLSDESAYFSSDFGDCEVNWASLHSPRG